MVQEAVNDQGALRTLRARAFSIASKPATLFISVIRDRLLPQGNEEQLTRRQRSTSEPGPSAIDRASISRLNRRRLRFSLPFFGNDGDDHEALQRPPLQRGEGNYGSLTSLEVESLSTGRTLGNNRLRAILDGIGLPSTSPSCFAGLDGCQALNIDIVVMGGYRGSILRSATDGRMLWVPIKVGMGWRKVELELPLNEAAEQYATDHIIPGGMLAHIGPIDIARRLLRRLRQQEELGHCRVHEFGYDWRLSGHHLSEQLERFLDSLSGRRKLVIAHSLGGLIALHAMNRRPDLFDGVLFAGTPFDGCPNILGPFRYGDDVLLNKDILNARANFTMRSSFLLLPAHQRCFVDSNTGKELPVDLFDEASWITYHLSPEVSRTHHDHGEAFDVEGQLASGGIGPGLDGHGPHQHEHISETTMKDNLAYLARILRATKRYKRECDFRDDVKYPPIAILRSASTPTVRGCRVGGRDGIRNGDYHHFITTPGDGVVAYKSADLRNMTPLTAGMCNERFPILHDQITERGHIGLLGDLSAVEECLRVLIANQS
ncbi:hypothetical protein PYCC9005_004834 [Savitreella phatthalungensis]